MDITLPSEEVADLMFYLLGHVNRGLEHLKTVFLFLDVIETLKFAGGNFARFRKVQKVHSFFQACIR